MLTTMLKAEELARAAIHLRVAEFIATMPRLGEAARAAMTESADKADLDPNDVASAASVLKWIEAAGYALYKPGAPSEDAGLPLGTWTDEQVVERAEELAKAMAGESGYSISGKVHTSDNPQVVVWWRRAAIAFDLLRGTDINDAVANCE